MDFFNTNKAKLDFSNKILYLSHCSSEVKSNNNKICLALNNTFSINNNLSDISLNIGEISESSKHKFEDLVKTFSDVLIEDVTKLKGCSLAPVKPEFTSKKPIYQKQYKIPHSMLEPIRLKLLEFEKAGIISRGESEYNVPLLAIKKPSGDIRVVLDLRQINKITRPLEYPQHNIIDILGLLNGSKYFSKIDLNNGYYQIMLDESVRNRYCFTLPWGRYVMNRMVQGARTSAAQFQKVMNEVLSDEISNGTILCYQDDILVHSDTEEKHLIILETLFRKLSSVNLAARPSKCFFFQKNISFLGHEISQEGATPHFKKLEAMKTFPKPDTIKKVRSFLGSINFYRRFIPNISEKAAPLYNLLKKGNKKFVWNEDCEWAFITLKNDMCSAPLLVHPNFNKTFFVNSDASSIAVGGVLEQEDDEGFHHPIAYCSRTLNKAERNYSVIEKETLGLVYALEQFRHFIYGYKIVLKTDHKPLSFLFSLKQRNQRITRWLLSIQDFNIEIEHISGKDNVIADMLSRGEEARNIGLINNIKIIQPISSDIIIQHQKDDPRIKLILDKINSNATIGNYFMDDVGIVYKKVKNSKRTWNYRILVPKSLVPLIISSFHGNAKSAHYGLFKVMWKIRLSYTWKGMIKDISHFVKTCEGCQYHKVHHSKIPFQPQNPPLFPLQKISMDFLGPFERNRGTGNKYILLFIDLFTRFPIAIPTRDMEATTVARVYVDHVYSIFGGSEFILTDRGANFTSKLFNELCKILGIKHLCTTSFHPQSNGVSERLNRVILNILSQLCNDSYDEWESFLQLTLKEIRNSIHKSTGESPHYLLFGADPIECQNFPSLTNQEEHQSTNEFIQNLIERKILIREKIEHNLKYSSVKNCNYRNKNTVMPSFCLGNKVLLLDPPSFTGKNRKLNKHYKGLYRIVEMRGPVNARIQSIDNPNDERIVHLEKLKLYHERILLDDTKFLEEIDVNFDKKRKKENHPSCFSRVTRSSSKL